MTTSDPPPSADRMAALAELVDRAVLLAGFGSGDEALELCRKVIDQPLSPPQLEAVAQIARDGDDDLLYRQALERLSRCEDAQRSAQALEQLGDFLHDRLGDRKAASQSWKAAAEVCVTGDREHAQTLYERALETLPNDLDAAKRLIDLYASMGSWMRLLDVLRLFIQSGDLERATEYLLRFQESAIEGHAADEFLTLTDEILAQLGEEKPAWLGKLKRAKSRVLVTDPSRQFEASQALRDLIESYGLEDDVRAFELLLESNPSAEERHLGRRWLYEWRVSRAKDPTEILLAWAGAELEYGDSGAARSVYERVSAARPGHTGALEAMCRLSFQAGDLEGGLAALEKLRGHVAKSQSHALSVSLADWLWTELRYTGEAAQVLAPALGEDPPYTPAHALAGRMLEDPATRAEAIDRFEARANVAPAEARWILDFLLRASKESSELPERRQRWFARIVEVARDAPEAVLSYALQGVSEAPDAIELWQAAETAALRLERPELVAQAYHRVFTEHEIPATRAAVLGPRMVALEEGRSLDTAASTEALLRVLEVIPEARWALDRVKFALSTAGRWSELWALYDKAIVAVANERDRGDILAEAAFAARDLAGDLKRAVHYYEFLRALRPDDVTVDGALERLYERLGLKRELVGLLTSRAEGLAGFRLRELEERIASLWLELGETANAHDLVERMLANGASVADFVPFLERIARPASPRSEEARAAAADAARRLKGHYQDLGLADELGRISEAAIDLAAGPEERERWAREWVHVLLPAAECPESFATIIEKVEARIAADPDLGAIIYKSLLVRAIRFWRRGHPEEASIEAREGAARIVLAFATLLVEGGAPKRAGRILYRASRLPFERTRRRQLAWRAALVWCDSAATPTRAVEILEELFDESASDAIAMEAFPRFAELLEAAGARPKLAARLQQQAEVRAKAGNAAAAATCWERAASIHEELGELDRAIAAYQQGAALESEASYEALARIHAERQEWREAANALEWLTAHVRGGERRLRALNLSKACEALGDRSRARSCLEQVLPSAIGRTLPGIAHETMGPDLGAQVRARLIELYRQDGVYKPLARLLSEQALYAAHLPQKLALVREACEILQSKLGAPEEATALLRLAVSWAPHDEGLRRWVLDALESLGKWDEAATHLRERIDAFGDQRSRDRALVHQRLARALVQASRPAEALAELRVAADMLPNSGSILNDLARVALEVGEVDLAEATYRAVLYTLHRTAPDAGAPTTGSMVGWGPSPTSRADVLLDLAEIALRKGEGDRATELVDSAFDEAIAGEVEFVRLGQTLASRHRYDLLAREAERCSERGGTLSQRALALGQWVEVWERHLAQSPEVAGRMRLHVQRLARELEQETLKDAAGWAALCHVVSALADADIRDRLAPTLVSAVASLRDGDARLRLRVSLARLLLQEPPRTTAAIGELEAALADHPHDPEALDLLSDALEHAGRFDDLVALLQRTAQLGGKGDAPALATAEWRLGRTLEKAGRSKEARELYESMLDRGPVDPENVSALSARLEELGSDRLADSLERWMALDPAAAPRLAKRVFELRERQGDHAGAARALEAAVASDPANSELRDRLVAHFEQQGQWSLATHTLRRAIEATPNEQGLFARLAAAYRRAGDRDALLSTLDAALATRPRDAELLGLRAEAREENGDLAGAVADLETASSVDAKRLGALLDLLGRIASRDEASTDERYLLQMAHVLTRLHRPKEARAALERLRARNPSHREALQGIAKAASADEDWAGAAEAHRALISLFPADEPTESVLPVASALVEAHQRAGKLAEARGTLGRALEALARDPSHWPEVERLSEAVGDWEVLAAIQLRRAEQQPDHEQQVALRIRAARLLLEQGASPAKALPVIEHVRSIAPESVEAALLSARAQVALGRPAEALAVLGEVLGRKRLPQAMLAAVHLQMAKAHLSVDGLLEAWQALRSAFSADPRDHEIALTLGLLSIDLDDPQTAERAMTAATKAKALDPSSRGLAFYHLANMAYVKGDNAKARLLATKAADGQPKVARKLLEKLGPVPRVGAR
jgi:tetratricopeptide (TPR) repeat protein